MKTLLFYFIDHTLLLYEKYFYKTAYTRLFTELLKKYNWHKFYFSYRVIELILGDMTEQFARSTVYGGC